MALKVKVGSFAKTTSAATASQAVTGVGFLPKALILFTAGQTSLETWQASHRSAIGFTTGAAASFSQSWSGQDAQATSNNSIRVAAKALTIVQYTELLLAECDLTSFDSGGFTLSWTTNDASAKEINYIALGGDDLTGAKAVKWNSPTAAGTVATSGLGFKPDLLLTNASAASSTLPSSVAVGSASFGVAIRGGGQFTHSGECFDAVNVAADARVMLFRFLDLHSTLASGTTWRHGAVVDSWDSDGFTLRYLVTQAAANAHIGLALKGGSWQIVHATKPTGAAPQTMTLEGTFTPKLLIVAGNTYPWESAQSDAGQVFCLGATDGTTSRCIGTIDTAAATTISKGLQRSGNVLSLPAGTSASLSAEAVTPTLANPTVLTWNPNNATAGAILGLIGGDTVTPGGVVSPGGVVLVT